MKHVALIGPADRPEIVRLGMRLEERGAEPVPVDPRADPTVWLAPDRIEAAGRDLAGIDAVYVADLALPSPVAPRADGRVDRAGSRRALARSRRHLAAWNALLERLARSVPVANPPATHDLHALKPWEVAVGVARGWPMPGTLATNDPQALLELAVGTGTHIAKGLVGGYGYTEVLEPPADGAAAAAALAESALLVQERAPGQNVRAFVVGGTVVGAAEIVATPGEVDSRRDNVAVRRTQLPDDVAAVARDVAATWGMLLAAVDLMGDRASGTWRVLECNSSPFFVEFERATGVDVSSALANELLGIAQPTGTNE